MKTARTGNQDTYPTKEDKALCGVAATVFMICLIVGGIVCRNFDLITIRLDIDSSLTYIINYAVEFFPKHGESITTHAGAFMLTMFQIKGFFVSVALATIALSSLAFRRKRAEFLSATAVSLAVGCSGLFAVENLSARDYVIGANQVAAICAIMCFLTLLPIVHKIGEGFDRQNLAEDR